MKEERFLCYLVLRIEGEETFIPDRVYTHKIAASERVNQLNEENEESQGWFYTCAKFTAQQLSSFPVGSAFDTLD